MRSPRLSAALLAAVLSLSACEREGGTGPAPMPNDPTVFTDGFGEGVSWQAFQGSLLTAMSIDNAVKYRGSASLKITIPDAGDPNAGYSGGAFVSDVARDFSTYDVVSFWAKASVAATLNVAGLGNDNTGTSKYTAERTDLALTTAWQKYTIAIPLASKLTVEKGLFFFAEGPEAGKGYTLWLDDIQFETLGTLTNPRPAITGGTYEQEVGDSRTIVGTTLTVAVGGVDQTVAASSGYFTFSSSNTAVATVTNGVISVAAPGAATITGSLGAVSAAGSIALTAAAPPAVAAPTPSRLAANVISLFSGGYTNRTIDTWSATWDVADVADVTIAGNATKKYSNLSYAGIEFTTAPIDATQMTGLHLDLWVTQAAGFKIKLVDFGANGVFGGGDDKEHEVTLNSSSSPAITTGAWNSVDIPFSAFTGLTTRGKLAQMIIAGSPTAYLDNVYFYKIPPPPGPTAAAATPTNPAAGVISLFSNAYTDRVGTTWSTVWDQADVADVQVAGDDVKKYTNLVFAGIEPASPIDASGMSTLNFDLWTPDSISGTSSFKVKLVDFGANGSFGGGDDTEHELTFTPTSTPALTNGSWVRFAIPLTNFTGLTSRAKLAQMILVSTMPTVYLDNIFFSADAPAVAAPTPTKAAGDVISLFSNAYTNRTVDTWSAAWDQADVSDVSIAGNSTKKYSGLVFAGIEFTTATIDASEMTHFSFDLWTPEATAAPAEFKVKLVDFGANNAFGGGDDKEQELVFSATSTPALETGSWVTFDIPLSAFTGLTTRRNLAQLIIVSAPSARTLFIDNMYFYKAPAPSGPQVSAAAPTGAAASVISLFSNAYTNRPNTTWSTVWDQADVTDVAVGSDSVKKYSNLVFAGIEPAAPVNAGAMTHFNFDLWTPDAVTGTSTFKLKLVDWGAGGSFGGGDDTEHELTFTTSSSPALATGTWVRFKVPLSSFTGMTGQTSIAQFIISGSLGTVYLDNIYFSADAPAIAAPTPTYAAGDVISLFSNAYTNQNVNTWSAEWDSADLADVQVAGNDVKKYSNLVFAGIEFTSSTVNATAMTHFSFDLWTPEATTAASEVKVKLVDFGTNNAFGGGDDKEHELVFSTTSTPALAGGAWVTFNIPLAQFTGLTTRGNLAQLILVSAPSARTVFIDNVLFHK
ncbi:MAG: hypothetical protein P3A32_05850 [Gemmatimonadota bacterium]|nr:hypothetical protein [Gemmatimonadota bacterium]MDQ8147439.1 hypothetical protein [Gemmatimonadota bacterium]MDQ8149330.1 hypothetical protein [Gemmatimonadota bacterium]MDQ8155997.1 hypothetical protein [Gemmatimonadota bacterium]MDQ8176876.1 hypothetical protein [Gemmatimonadota bacterium]